MAGIIGMSGVGGGNSYGEIINFQIDEVGKSCFFVSYDVRDAETNCIHNLVLNGKELGADGKVGNGHFELTVANLEPETEYGVQIKINNEGYELYSKTLAVKTSNYPIYSLIINEDELDPFKRVSYSENSIGIEPATNTGYGGWNDKFPFNQIKICGLKNGKVYKYIKPENKKEYIDGTPVTEEVDVMIEFPKFYWNAYRLQDGSKFKIDISQYRQNEYFDCPAHNSGDYEVDNVYLGVYLGSEVDGKIRSISGKKPAQVYFEEAERMCVRNGKGYHQIGFYQNEILHLLYTLAFGNTDSENSLGCGYVENYTGVRNTGSNDLNGMVYGKTERTIFDITQQKYVSNKGHEKSVTFCGIEDIYGNSKYWINGLSTDKYNAWVLNLNNENFAPYEGTYNQCRLVNGIERTNKATIGSVVGMRDAIFLPTGILPKETFFNNKRNAYGGKIISEPNSAVVVGSNYNDMTYNSSIYNLEATGKSGNIFNRYDKKAGVRLMYIPPTSQEVYGVKIDEIAKSTERAVSFIEDSAKIKNAKQTGGNANLNDLKYKNPFYMFRTCGLKNGKVYKYIKNECPTEYIDGTPVTEEVDVMIEIPKVYWNIKRPDLNNIEVRISDEKINQDFVDLAHTVGDKEVDCIYIGKYEASLDTGGNVRSLKDKKPLTNMSLVDFRNKCKAKGNGYASFNYYSALMLQNLYLSMFGYLYSGSSDGLAEGNVKNTNILLTGSSKNYMTGGQNGGDKAMSFLGIENLWGNTSTWVDGLYVSTDESGNSTLKLSKNDVFNDTGVGYEDAGKVILSNGENRLYRAWGDNKRGFIGDEFSGLNLTKNIDGTNVKLIPCYVNSQNIANGSSYTFGGCHKDDYNAGIFTLRHEPKSATVGGRLIYIPQE